MIDRWSIWNILSRYLISAKLTKTKSTNSTNHKIKKLRNWVLMISMNFKCIRRQILLKLVVRPDLSSTIFAPGILLCDNDGWFPGGRLPRCLNVPRLRAGNEEIRWPPQESRRSDCRSRRLVATVCVSSGVLSSNIGSRADHPKDDGPGMLLSWDDFWGESGMTITFVDELVVVCMSVGSPPVKFPLVIFFWGLSLVDFWGGDDFLFPAKICPFSKVTVWSEESTIASLNGLKHDSPIH